MKKDNALVSLYLHILKYHVQAMKLKLKNILIDFFNQVGTYDDFDFFCMKSMQFAFEKKSNLEGEFF